jgi:hypothetical protein
MNSKETDGKGFRITSGCPKYMFITSKLRWLFREVQTLRTLLMLSVGINAESFQLKQEIIVLLEFVSMVVDACLSLLRRLPFQSACALRPPPRRIGAIRPAPPKRGCGLF